MESAKKMKSAESSRTPGTHRSSRRRWLAAKLATLFAFDGTITALASALIVGIWFATIAHVLYEREEAVESAIRQNSNLAKAFEEHITRAIKGIDQVVLFLRHDYMDHGAPIGIGEYAAKGVINAGLFHNFLVVDRDGNVLASQVAASSENFSDRDYFRHHKANDRDELFIGKPVIGRLTGKWVIPVTRRLITADGGFGGVLVLSVNPEYLLGFYRQADIGHNGLFDVAGLDGISRVRKIGEVRSFGEPVKDGAVFRARLSAPDGNLQSDAYGDNVDRFLSYRTLKEYPLMVAVGVSREEVLAPLKGNGATYFIGAILASAMVALFANLLMGALMQHRRGVEALARSEARFRATFNQAAIGIVQTTLDGRFLAVNQRMCEMLGYTAEEMLAMNRIDISHPDERASSAERRAQLLAGNSLPAAVEKRYLCKDGSLIWVAVSAALVRDANGAPEYFVNMVECITERKQLQENLERLARHDNLTQLPNRGLFYNRLQHALEQARRRDWVTGVMFIDLDRFKTINDTLGHGVGDELLQQVAERLKKCVRAEDTVGRLGGDEFAVILSELAEEQSAGIVAQKILDALGRPFQLERHEVFITTSIGITTCASGEADADTMISNADAAMYDAKNLGRNNYQFYAATMSERAMERLLLEKELRYALSRNEFLLNFQPKVNLRSGEITGFEALLRWHRTGGEIVSPAVFIPVIEECGLIEEVGEWVIRTTCAQISAWQKAGIRPVAVAVNLSPKQFQHHDIGSVVTRALKEHDVDPALLELEITESTAMNNAENAIAALKNLKALGVRIAIDDFGTGYSSLSYLTRFPIDSLKIDRSFVVDLPDSREGASIARAVITMSHALRLKVIAEGVENLAQLDFLADNACDEIQGYYCSRPLPAEQATELLSGRRRLITRPQLVSVAA
jgi:diguanylate cyclase (GGDEF)-like protein/PAS domain S-box-containing protein